MGFVFIRETKEEALNIGTPSLDLIYETSVDFNLSLPHETEYLNVRISNMVSFFSSEFSPLFIRIKFTIYTFYPAG